MFRHELAHAGDGRRESPQRNLGALHHLLHGEVTKLVVFGGGDGFESVFVLELVEGGGSLRQGVCQRAVGIEENHLVFRHGADGDVTGSLC